MKSTKAMRWQQQDLATRDALNIDLKRTKNELAQKYWERVVRNLATWSVNAQNWFCSSFWCSAQNWVCIWNYFKASWSFEWKHDFIVRVLNCMLFLENGESISHNIVVAKHRVNALDTPSSCSRFQYRIGLWIIILCAGPSIGLVNIGLMCLLCNYVHREFPA